ncbi:kinase-like domain-containing protein [Kockovaella imperatae]|uniref:Kinase-like domain-containing protein n=1 Tax=Kockovaella imperatae TaxID=4999 RepID=A0A1Y1UC20_9TREE|nr:kinase-like domain-containing protein [Kockovaella imperatae]ORX35036.1 kinase-like domain-containing protein [Kockovaella imperatae]
MVEFDVIPYKDIVWGRKLGSGSFGSVYKGTYLGIDIAIKEITASTEYDVHKYFEREWRIMRECRHPNIVLFLGLSQETPGDGKVYIVSEFVPSGNLRQYILSARPFPWRLRLSFSTDVARAVAYLHARQCIHRDLKGENLLLTSNERVKVTDFGFARIASRSAEEMKRMTYCGTDGYMSPEIINGLDFDLPTDVFSLGIIFMEIMSRRLVDSHTFIRAAPAFVPDPEEVRRRASPGCPKAFVQLALDCCEELPSKRPKMPEILGRLRDIELEVVSRTDDPSSAEHVGSVKLLRHTGPRAMPIFQPLTPVAPAVETGAGHKREVDIESDHADEDEDEGKMEQEALATLAGLDIDGGGATPASSIYGTFRTARWEETPSILGMIPGHDGDSDEREVQLASAMQSDIQAPVKDDQVQEGAESKMLGSGLESVMTIRGQPALVNIPTKATVNEEEKDHAALQAMIAQSEIGTIPSLASEMGKLLTKQQKGEQEDKEDLERVRKSAVGTHRFTLVDKDAAPLWNGKKISSCEHFTSWTRTTKTKASQSRHLGSCKKV